MGVSEQEQQKVSAATSLKKHWYERMAWVLLLLIQLLILLVVSSGDAGPFAEGSVIDAFQTTNVTDAVLATRMLGTVLLGMFLFGVSILLKPFREGARWAWAVMWYIPVFFVLHIYAFGTVIPDAIFAALAAVCLLASYWQAFGKSTAEAASQ